ncbi:MAG: SDR family NAD(P)-dependent oxidoreductase [Alphaproteobacteria bacterium]|nr:SDR family NAD(P)-dependent oxidoreductase [Alphaproteobacteria bacterium]
MQDNSKKNTLITGASRGLGFFLATQHAKRGDHIIALAKTQGGLTELDDSIKKATGHNATLIPFNLTSPDTSFAMLGQTLFERFGKLHRLILNAATIGPSSPVAHTTEKDWQLVMDVNVTANIRLLRHLDPLLRNAGNPHITFVTCSSLGDAYWGAYGASKAALNQLAASYAVETKQAGFKVDVFDPGVMATQLRRNAYPGEDQSQLDKPADIALRYVNG